MTPNARHCLVVFSVLAVAVAPGIGAAAGSTDVALEPTGQTVTNGEAATFDVVVTNASGGVGAANISFSVANDTAAITQVAFSHEAAEVNTTYASDNSSATLAGYGLDTNQTGQVVVATVTVEGNATSTAETMVTPEVNALGDEDGNDYSIGDERSAQLEITTSSSGGGGGSGDGGDDSDGGGDSGGGGDGDTASTTVTNLSVATTDVETGESVEATATVLNDGDVTTNATVNLTVDGSIESTKTVTDLEPGNESTVVFLPAFQQAGTYNLSVGGESATITVAEPTTTSDPVTTETPTETESQAPGFGVLSALVSLVALIGAARLRAN
ncbi:putative secreted glycoprotein [Haloferax gibbonsii]|uniref:Secreted glycoprotein n=1 Tax=Haloferax gibbonsii TaxID=35746 RepID=A0A871BIP9_HALGI|nr:CARDB domain-containing protein [Haloferax gibbonsii]QOS12650.1 putative secreted glycoprotein [Haloferax gibbonsii]